MAAGWLVSYSMAAKYVGAILGLMGVLQALSFADFTQALETYDLLSGPGAQLLGIAIILGELGAAFLLFSKPRRGAAVAAVVMVVWTVFAFQGLLRGLDVPNCGCFGRWLSQPLTWWVIPQDLYLLGMAGWIYRKESLSLNGSSPVRLAA